MSARGSGPDARLKKAAIIKQKHQEFDETLIQDFLPQALADKICRAIPITTMKELERLDLTQLIIYHEAVPPVCTDEEANLIGLILSHCRAAINQGQGQAFARDRMIELMSPNQTHSPPLSHDPK